MTVVSFVSHFLPSLSECVSGCYHHSARRLSSRVWLDVGGVNSPVPDDNHSFWSGQRPKPSVPPYWLGFVTN